LIRFVTDPEERADIAGRILSALPDWFGLPENTKKYIDDSRALPFWAEEERGEERGFLALKPTSPATVEIYVMGVLPEHHRTGIGRALWERGLAYAREQGFQYAQVKTVQSGHYDEYDRTNRFYQSLGFQELEVLPTLWDTWNPCQIYVMYIGT